MANAAVCRLLGVIALIRSQNAPIDFKWRLFMKATSDFVETKMGLDQLDRLISSFAMVH